MKKVKNIRRYSLKIIMKWKNGSITGTLNNSGTAEKVKNALPVTGSAQCWGKEVYFSIPVTDTLSPDAGDVVEPGTICFWVQGSSIAIPFGPTPASRGDECRLVTKVNSIGTLEGDFSLLETIAPGDTIVVEKKEM
jgi:uncharacterized protein